MCRCLTWGLREALGLLGLGEGRRCELREVEGRGPAIPLLDELLEFEGLRRCCALRPPRYLPGLCDPDLPAAERLPDSERHLLGDEVRLRAQGLLDVDLRAAGRAGLAECEPRGEDLLLRALGLPDVDLRAAGLAERALPEDEVRLRALALVGLGGLSGALRVRATTVGG